MKQEQLEFMKPVKRKEERERKEEGEGGVGRREKEERRGNVPRRGKKETRGREGEKKRCLDYIFHSLSLC